MPIQPHIQIDGLRELQRDIKKAQGKLPATLGAFHKEVGQFVISKVPPGDPHAVGSGSGADIRASATKRDVLIRVGHGARQGDWDQWGKKRIRPVAPGPHSRPFIVGVIEENEEEIADKYLSGILDAMRPAFAEVSKE